MSRPVVRQPERKARAVRGSAGSIFIGLVVCIAFAAAAAGVGLDRWAEGGAELWQRQPAAMMVGLGMLAIMLLLYRRTRTRLRPLWVIREALLAAASGDENPERLEIDSRLGPEAQAWNRLMSDSRRLRQQTPGESVADALLPRRSLASDLDAACDVMSNGLLLVDARLRVKFANGAAAVYLRSNRDDLLGRDLSEVLRDEKLVASVQSIAGGATNGLVMTELKREGDAGTGVLRFSVRPVRKGDGAAAMIVIDDVTQQRVAESARNSFVAQVAHELRAPLTNIRLYVESAIEAGVQDTAVRENCLNVINQESRRLERIVGEMLSIAEIEAGALRLEKGDVHLDVLLEEARVDFAPQANEKKINLEFNLPPKLPVLQGDRDKIALAVHNLVGNAIKYTPAGGRVVVAVEVARGQVCIEVADSGIGIRPEELELIFERFYRARDTRVAKITGTGLGLTLAREVARLHGGDITVQSQLDKGSTFTLVLPAGSSEG